MRISISIAAALGAALLASAPAHADEPKLYSGTFCVANNGATLYSGGRIFNTSSGFNTFECAALRDHTDGGLWGGWVVVIDRNDSQSARCDLSVQDSNSFDLLEVDTRFTAIAGNDFQRLDFTKDLHAPDPTSFYALTCIIPGVREGLSSGIASFLLDEDD